MVQIELDLFSTPVIEKENAAYSSIKKGDRIKAVIDHMDDETLNYYKYYYPIVLNAVGEVLSVNKETKNVCLEVMYKNGDIILIEKMFVKKED